MLQMTVSVLGFCFLFLLVLHLSVLQMISVELGFSAVQVSLGTSLPFRCLLQGFIFSVAIINLFPITFLTRSLTTLVLDYPL